MDPRFGRMLATVLASASVPLEAQEHQHPPAHEAVELGTLSFPTSAKPAAQAHFIRGVKLLHNFAYEWAAEAFKEAEKADPDFALAYWGEAMAYNETLWSNQDAAKGRAALLKLGPTPEGRAAKAPTGRERAWLDAVETLYGAGSKFERDVAYADKMDALAKAYPNDVEAQVFDALALLGRSHGEREKVNYERAGAKLTALFRKHPDHPGIAHYLIHSYDDPTHARQGLSAAQVYDRLAPDSAHAQHMTSHIFLALGMWPEVERANIRARQAQERSAGKTLPRAACGHGGIWLVYARLQEGKSVDANIAECGNAAQQAMAEQKDFPTVGGLEGPYGTHADMRVRQGIETGEWVKPLVLPEGKLNYARLAYAYGDLLAARHDVAQASAAFTEMQKAHHVMASDFRKENPDDAQTMAWVDLALDQGRAMVLLASGKRSEGLRLLRRTAEQETKLPALFGPPIVQKPTWELLGDELLAAGDKRGAAEAYRRSLALQPGRRMSLAGLKAATAS